MSIFILVSGAWHGAWCWERVVPILASEGHTILTPDLLGTGSDATPPAGITLAAWADQIAELVRRQPEPVVLVGHSRGGIVISEAAERVPSAIRSLVYVAAFLVPDGTTMLQVLLGASHDGPKLVMIEGPDQTTMLAPATVQAMLYNLTPDDLVERAQALNGPEPMRPILTPLELMPENYGAVPRAYIECTNDRAVPIELQRAMQAVLPCAPVVTLATDHSPFFSDPAALAAALSAVASHR